MDQVQCLRADDAIEKIGGRGCGLGKIQGQGAPRIIRVDVDHIAVLDSIAPKAARVIIRLHLSNSSADRFLMDSQEFLDVETIDALPAPCSKVFTVGTHTAEDGPIRNAIHMEPGPLRGLALNVQPMAQRSGNHVLDLPEHRHG